MHATPRCPQCGAHLPDDAPAGLCPRCLVAAGLASEPAAATDPQETTPFTPSGAFVPPEPAELAKQFADLEIFELLGAGGMGAVYKARQKELDRVVAVKILPPEVGADPTFAERFSREAKALARLGHPNIVTVHNAGQRDGLFYFVMEYVDGISLRDAMHAGNIEPKQALSIVAQICEALQYAHDADIVHRDVKPENVLLTKDGRVKIADFGLAKLMREAAPDARLTGTAQVMGTYRYMAPEQMEGAANVDHRADIYSLGIVFYELLTGDVPMGRFPPPSQKVEIDVRLDEVVLRSLENQPEKRYQRASQVRIDVEAISSSAYQASGESSNELGQDVRNIDRSNASGIAGAMDQNVDDRQRAAELAELAPDWLCFPFMGLFGAGWVIVGLMWNFRWPGLIVAIAVMGAITYYIVQWKLVYQPKLRLELQREPRWSRGTTLAQALAIFTLAVLCVIWFQAVVGDLLTNSSLVGPRALAWSGMTKQEGIAAAEKVGFEGLTDGDLLMGSGGFGYTMFPMMFLMVGLWAVLFLFLSIATTLQTRRYRYTWRRWWAPSLSVSFYCLGMLVVVHFLHLLMVGYASSRTEPREIRCNAGWDTVETALRHWSMENGYEQLAYENSKIAKEDVEVGQIHYRQVAPISWFDRYQASWRQMILRPHPPLSITVATRKDPVESYMRIMLPQHAKDSPELAMWTELVDDLEATIRVATDHANKTKVGRGGKDNDTATSDRGRSTREPSVE